MAAALFASIAAWPERRRLVITSALLAVVVIAVYSRAVGFGYVDFDDHLYITDNPEVRRGLTLDGIAWAFTTFAASNWHPLTWLSHMLDHDLFGLAPGPRHAVNVAIHATNAVLLLIALRRLTGAFAESALAAAVFALHPQHVESVAWIAERKDVLSLFFALLALVSYARWAERSRGRDWALVTVWLALALLTKPTFVTLPFVFLLLDWWPLRRTPRTRLREKLPWFALVVLSSFATVAAQQAGGSMLSIETWSLPARIANALLGYGFYVGKTVWPSGLAIFYPRDAVLPVVGLAIAVLFLAGATFAAWRLKGTKPYGLTGWFWYLGTLVPMLGVVQVGQQATADRYAYVPSIGLSIVAAWAFTDFARSSALRQKVMAASAVAIFSGLVVVTWLQVGHWASSISLFEHAVAVTEANAQAEALLAQALVKEGRADEGKAHFETALRIKPDYVDAHNNLGVLLASRNQLKEARQHFMAALERSPNRGEALANLRRVQAQLAVAEGGSTRDDAEAHYRLGNVAAGSGKPAEAVREYEAALQLDPTLAKAHHNLGVVLAGDGRRDEAIRHLEEALRLDPAYALARDNLQIVRVGQGTLRGER
jgi:protein O-mannosyl-transferase